MKARSSGRFKISYQAETSLLDTPLRKFAIAALVVGLVGIAFLAERTTLNRFNVALLAIIGASALNILTGLAGQVSLAHAAMLAVGAFSAANVAQAGLPFPLVVLVAAGVGALAGMVAGLPSLRFRGLYLILGTIAFHHVVIYLLRVHQKAEAGGAGLLMPRPSIGPLEIRTSRDWYLLLAATAGFVVLACLRLRRASIGRAWLMLRERDIPASMIGIPVGRYKLWAFAVSSGLAGLQGALFAYYYRVVDIESFTLLLGIEYVVMVVIGGLGSVLGAVLGAIFMTQLQYFSAGIADAIPAAVLGGRQGSSLVFDVQAILFGMVLIIFLLLDPRGLAEIWVRLKHYVLQWPFGRVRV